MKKVFKCGVVLLMFLSVALLSEAKEAQETSRKSNVKKSSVVFSGGNGESMSEAIIITGKKDEDDDWDMIYQLIASKYPGARVPFIAYETGVDGKEYKVCHIKMPDPEMGDKKGYKYLYFDDTEYRLKSRAAAKKKRKNKFSSSTVIEILPSGKHVPLGEG